MTTTNEFSAGAAISSTSLPLAKQDSLSSAADARVCGLTQGEISRAIGFARLVLIIGLVFIHYEKFPNLDGTLFGGIDTHEHKIASWLGSTILYFFFSSVPLLSMISGWLFFSFRPAEAWPTIKKRMWRRFKSLYVPLVAWNAFYTACIVAFFFYHPHSAFFNELEFDIPFHGPMDLINAVFGITHRPIGFQFWFVRDLFVTAMISPLLWLGIRYAPWPLGIFLGLSWIMHSHILIFWRADVPFFFTLGALIHQKNFNIAVPRRMAIIGMIVYVVLVALRALAPYAVNMDQPMQVHMLDVATSLMRLAGVVGCWGALYRYAQTPRGIAIGNYGGLAFFLHSAHWPLVVILKMALWPLMPGDSDAAMLLHYALCVTLTVAAGLGLGNLLAHKTPRFFALMNGGRLLKQTRV